MGAATVETNADAIWEDRYLAPTCSASGEARSSLFWPDGYSLWQVEAELAAGSELMWGIDHGDEGLYVIAGAIECDGRVCGPETAIVIEAGAEARVRVTEAARVVHAGPASSEPPHGGHLGAASDGARGVHVIGIDEARPLYEDRPRGPRYYTDGTCDTCRIAFFRVAADEPSAAPSHVHSEDEIIRVLTGELRVGPITIPAGVSIAIPANHRYGFRTPGAYSFLNYRRDASTYQAAPGSEPMLETIDNFRAARAAREAG